MKLKITFSLGASPMYQMRQAMLAPKSEEPTTHESQVDCNTKQCLQLLYDMVITQLLPWDNP